MPEKKNKAPLIVSILAVSCPLISVIVSIFTEPEIVEAIFGGIVIGCMIGSVFGLIALIINKGRYTIVKILSVLPMIPVVLFLMLAIPVIFYK